MPWLVRPPRLSPWHCHHSRWTVACHHPSCQRPHSEHFWLAWLHGCILFLACCPRTCHHVSHSSTLAHVECNASRRIRQLTTPQCIPPPPGPYKGRRNTMAAMRSFVPHRYMSSLLTPRLQSYLQPLTIAIISTILPSARLILLRSRPNFLITSATRHGLLSLTAPVVHI